MIRKKIGILLAVFCLVLTAGCAKREKASVVPPLPTPAEAAETAAPTPTPVPTPTPTPKNLLPPLPDVDINSWEFLYAGPHCGVGRYHPHVGNFEGQYLDERCVDAANEFMAAARNSGFEVYVCTAYRNWEYTTFWYEQEMFKYGEFDYEYNHFLPGASYEAAKHGFAAGCSEHSTGLAFDITDEAYYWADVNYSNIHDETVAGRGGKARGKTLVSTFGVSLRRGDVAFAAVGETGHDRHPERRLRLDVAPDVDKRLARQAREWFARQAGERQAVADCEG